MRNSAPKQQPSPKQASAPQSFTPKPQESNVAKIAPRKEEYKKQPDQSVHKLGLALTPKHHIEQEVSDPHKCEQVEEAQSNEVDRKPIAISMFAQQALEKGIKESAERLLAQRDRSKGYEIER